MLEKPDPKQLAASLRAVDELNAERREKLSAFRDAGWSTNSTHFVFRELAGQSLSANYKNGQFEMFFFGAEKMVYFNSAKEALEYVDAVEKQLGEVFPILRTAKPGS